EPYLEERIRAERERAEDSAHDEVWEGVYIVSPIANIEHQVIVMRLSAAIDTVLDQAGGGLVFPGVNVSDREEGWLQNYRVPDVAVVFPGGRAKDCDTHLCGG